MNDFNANYQYGARTGTMDMAVDQGLRSFMLGVYNKMGLGLVVSGALAFVTSSVAPVRDMLFTANGGYTGIGMLLSFAPLIVMFVAMFAMKNPSKTGASLYYWAIVSLIGAGLGVLAIRYTGESLATTFFVTAAAFGGLSLFGYTTKKNLSGLGSFLIMAVIGLVLASVVNAFLGNSVLSMIISAAGVLIFSGLIAYDTQNLKHTYYAIGGNQTALSVATSFGALSLYLDFINLFQFLLSFMGSRD
jgi:uncharacterized protein